jgi:uncharacterized protein involved in type VI secretion and phage assembly
MTTTLPSFLARRVIEADLRNDRVFEAVVGVVTDNKDPDKLGRVKVKFPTLSAEDSSGWAPIASVGAGKDRGWFFLPEVDDEVLVMFEHGDMRRPVVVGALWNGVDSPPEQNGGGNERRTIVSRAGSRITFDDDGGTVTLEDGGGAGKVVISGDEILLEAPSGDVSIYAPSGDLTVVAQEIKLEASQSLRIKTGAGLKMGSDAGLTIQGSMVTISAAKVDINGGGAQSPAEASASCESVPDPVKGSARPWPPGSLSAPFSVRPRPPASCPPSAPPSPATARKVRSSPIAATRSSSPA